MRGNKYKLATTLEKLGQIVVVEIFGIFPDEKILDFGKTFAD